MDATFEDLSAPCSSTSTSSASSSASQIPVADSDDERAYFVPYRWWKEAHKSSSRDSDVKGVVYLASSTSSYPNPMKIINNIFNSDLAFNMRREEVSNQNNESSEVGVSGRDFALVSGQMWLQALKWHSDSRYAMKQSDPKSGSMHRRSFSAAEDDMADVYPLQLRLTVLRDISTLGVKISKKDNAVELFRRSCKIFNVDYDQLRIWDFSGQINQFFSNEKNKLSRDSHRQSDLEILLELQVYGLSDSMKCNNGKKDEVALQQHNLARSSSVSSFMMNGCSGNVAATLSQTNTTSFYGSFSESGSLSLTGLQNLGNTCFMNSALQCLVHTPKLVDYFLGDYNREINHDNPLGMDGEIALAFGDLLRKLWAPGATPVPPKIFKSKLARFAPQFSGFNQHDSQELLAFLLDGLHEDLNRVKCKPYVEVKDGEDRPDEDVADEYWQNHLARNDSIIVDVCQGQYRSTLVCPDCKKVSVTFDPFMYLSLPLPSTTMRTMTLTIMSTDGSIMPAPFTVTVPKSGKFEDLIQALSSACSLGVDEMLLVAEIYNNRIIRFLDDPSDSLSLIRDDDQLVAYRLAKDVDKAPLIVFMHQRMEEQRLYGKMAPGWKAFGIPLVARLCTDVNGSDISSLYLDLLKPFLIPKEDVVDICDRLASTTVEEVTEKGDPENLVLDGDTGAQVDGNDSGSQSETNVLFHLTDEKGIHKNSQILMNEPVSISGSAERLNVLACWPENQIKNYNVQLLNSLPEVFKSSFFAKKPQESVSLYKCLEAFLKEEPLGPEDMWYCPGCKTHRQASKKLDLWRLPEILVIHLKRFSYSRYTKNKLETFVDFPIDNLDLSTYVAYQNGESSKRYMLYAVSNHFGNMGGGHYTAFVHQGGGRWYDFDDSRVYPVNEDKIKSSAAYVLFYRRIDDA